MARCWRGFLVDLDNTLHDYERAARAARHGLACHIERQCGVPAADVLQRYDALLANEANTQWASAHAMRIGRLGRLMETWSATRSIAIEPMARLLETMLLQGVRAFDGAREAFASLRAKAPTMIVTEGYLDMQSQIAARLGLDIAPEALLATKRHGVRKLDGSAYELACDILRAPAGSLAMIGDNWDWDIVASSRVGMWQVWANSHAPERGPIPDRFLGRVAGLRDVPSLLALHAGELS